MELVQHHERGWGLEQYPERPTLIDLLNQPVVVFWSGMDKSPQQRLTASIHSSVDELNHVLLKLILASKTTPTSAQRLFRLFVNKQIVEVKGISLILDNPQEQET